MIYRFHHIHLLCSDLQNSINFFTEVLGTNLAALRKFGVADGAVIDLEGTIVNLRVERENESVK